MHRVWWLIFNAVWFQGIWLSAVLGGNKAALFIAGLLLMHVLLQSNRLQELAVMGACGLIGVAFDSVLFWLGLYVFMDNESATVLPAWLFLLWFGFAGTLLHSLGWLVKRPGIGAPLGAGAAAFSYYAAHALGAVSFPHGASGTVLFVGLYWLAIIPIAHRVTGLIAKWLSAPDGQAQPLLAYTPTKEKL